MSFSAGFQLRQHVRQSLWVVPVAGTVAGLALAGFDLWLEDRFTFSGAWSYSPSTAAGVLSAVAGAMIGLVGLVVTIGVLVVQMATSTLSPRFMRLWYRDRLQKVVLASFTATFTFAFALLREVGADSVPNLGVTLAGVAVTIDLVLLLLYLDRFVHALRPVAVASAMARAGLKIVADIQDAPAVPQWDLARSGRSDLHVAARRSGAIQAVNVSGIVTYAERHGLVCVMEQTVGDFVTPGGPLMTIHGSPRERDVRQLRGMIALGAERTIEQDAAFAMRIVVDIAIRALSPAVNDPTTATQMLNHLGVLLAAIGSRDLQDRHTWVDGAGEPRLVVPTRSWEDYLDLGFSEIRAYGGSSMQVCRRMRALLEDLEITVLPANRPAVRAELSSLDRTVARGFPEPDDRAMAMQPDRQGIGGAGHTRPAGWTTHRSPVTDQASADAAGQDHDEPRRSP